MGFNGGHEQAAFGWSVRCGGEKPGKVRQDVRELVQWAADEWSSCFPRDRGYKLEVSSPAGSSNGVQLYVHRGDFRAEVTVENFLDRQRDPNGERVVRTFGHAESASLASFAELDDRLVERCQNAGFAAGLAAFLAFCWMSIGVEGPIHVLGGLLMTVAALLMTTIGSTFGSFIGERWSQATRSRALMDAATDDRLHEDLRRWQALVRRLHARRYALSGSCPKTPFRALPAASSAAA